MNGASRAATDGFSRAQSNFSRSWLTGHQAGDPLSRSSSSAQFDSTSPTAPTRGRHHRSYAPYPIPSTYDFNEFQTVMGLLNCMGSQQLRPFLFPLRKSPGQAVYAEVGTDISHPLWVLAHVLQSHHPSRPITPSADGQEVLGSSWTPADFTGPFPYPNYPPLSDWHNSPSMTQIPSIPSHHPHVSFLPSLPVIQADPAWQDAHPTAGTNTQSTSSSPAHSPFRDTPTPADQSEGGSKGKKRSRGRYRKEDPADRYLRESTEDGNRLWTCMWVEPSHGTPNSSVAQNICGHQAPKSNARQHVKSRHLKLRYVNLFLLCRLSLPGPTNETHPPLLVL